MVYRYMRRTGSGTVIEIVSLIGSGFRIYSALFLSHSVMIMSGRCLTQKSENDALNPSPSGQVANSARMQRVLQALKSMQEVFCSL